MRDLKQTVVIIIILFSILIIALQVEGYMHPLSAQMGNTKLLVAERRKTIQPLLYEYKQYSTECYSDSTHWVNQQPDFPGFMDFLERKYGESK